MPKIIDEGEATKLVANITIGSKTHEMWYSVPRKFEKYLVTECLDGYVVGILPLAMKLNESIHIKGAISERLLYQLTHYLVPTLSYANSKWSIIDITADEVYSDLLARNGSVGTGISAGVDSFSTVIDHINEGGFEVEYFTFFNVGSHGDKGGERARELFWSRADIVKPFVDEYGGKFLTVDSNISELLGMLHQETHTLRSASCVLILQKLFKYYYYASAFRIENFKLSEYDMSYYDIYTLNMLSTNATTFYSSVVQYTRVQRTELLTKNEITKKYLNVCVKLINEDGNNCSECFKCMRTELTLDIIGKLQDYEKVFDLEKYYKKKVKFSAYIIANKKDNIHYNEIVDLMASYKYSVSGMTRLFIFYYAVKRNITKLIKSI